ncbi:hypothetical protein BN990_03956 [Virgibacillus salexigens]|uniref:Uncharacterized protein n=2 Tax=Virgibacillus TaxID=84406 RepID=A0A024QGA8_9BACI|nr:hypothetical protein BN990_03956 [Virgibacillus massiliensis]
MNIDLFRMVNNLGKDLTYLNPTIVFVAEYMVFLLALGHSFLVYKKQK